MNIRHSCATGINSLDASICYYIFRDILANR